MQILVAPHPAPSLGRNSSYVKRSVGNACECVFGGSGGSEVVLEY